MLGGCFCWLGARAGLFGRDDGDVKAEASSCGKDQTHRRIECDFRIARRPLQGHVYLATSFADGQQHVVKRYQKKDLVDPRRRYSVQNEVEIQASLDHPHIARLEQVYESESRIDFVIEHLSGGDLHDRLADRLLSESEAARVMFQLLSAVAYLHERGIIHRDVKLENVGIAGSGHIKLLDFGLATRWDHKTKLSQRVGTYMCLAPEVLTGSGLYSDKVDIWAAGIMMYEMLTGYSEFDVSKCRDLSKSALELLRLLLTWDPDERPSAAAALRHPWLRSAAPAGAEPLKECLALDEHIAVSLEDLDANSQAEIGGITL